MSAPLPVLELLARFNDHRATYAAGQYNETQLRREFLDPFFKALGWDMDNSAGYAEPYKDVIHEDAIRIAGAIKAPDYCFRIGGTRKFFLEAKKPSISIKDEISSAYQLRRYAWSAKLPLSILSDFEEFAVYDCRSKPVKTDPAATARVFYCTCDEYPEKFDWIASIFSRDAVLKGSFDKFAETNKTKRGTADVDDDFLATIESWRSELARSLALRNPALSTRELNFAVQRIIDRIVFLRICEDRGIEDYGRLLALTNGNRIYPRLCELFVMADARYNSGLFCFKKEKGRIEQPDEFTHALEVDDEVLRAMLKAIYYPDSPYAFSVISSDILGQVYEQFLGKVIRLTDGHRAKVEDKPEVKKAGGVYYTPTYIVDYIVQQTVGRLVADKTPRDVAGMRVLDPACGSGSFLIGAYQFLLDWHLNWYTANDPEKWAKGSKPTLVQVKGGWKLTIAERKRILLDSIYGVDIDTQAVEVTKLSLLLKVLEGESEQSVQQVFDLFHERALPDLGSNIKCGNSLIGPDFYQQANLLEMSDDDRLRINVFDWHTAFPEIFRVQGSGSGASAAAQQGPAAGFDAVIGNPPYGAFLDKHEVAYMRAMYTHVQGEIDSYLLFIEKGISLCHHGGLLSLIIPDTWLTLINAAHFRKWLLSESSMISIAALNEFVFGSVTVDPLVLVLQNSRPKAPQKVLICCASKKEHIENIDCLPTHEYEQSKWLLNKSAQITLSMTSDVELICNKLSLQSVALGDIMIYRAGCKPYEVGKGKPSQTKATLSTKPFTSHTRPSSNWKRLIRGDDVQKYILATKKDEWIHYGEWLAAPRDWDVFSGSRILVQAIRNPSLKTRIVACITDEEIVSRINVYTLKPKSSTNIDLHFLLGVVNSRLMNWFLKKNYGLHTYVITGVVQLPLRIIQDRNDTYQRIRDSIVSQVRSIIENKQRNVKLRTPHEQEALQRQIAATDQQIDRLVYELYGLTEDEIAIVEQAP